MENKPLSLSSVSAFEDMLFRSSSTLCITMFNYVSTRELLILSKLNKRLSYIVRFYGDIKWDVVEFLQRFFSDVDKVLSFMHDESAIFFGPAVFQFFDRSVDSTISELDICIHLESVHRFNDVISEAGFKYKDSAHVGRTLATAISLKIALLTPHKLKSSGERNWSEADRSPFGPFDFHRSVLRRQLRLVLHIVRCDPYRYILALDSTAMMNYITWNCAVCLFPKSAFINRRSFVACQEDLPWRYLPQGYRAWFQQYAKVNGFDIVGISHRRYLEAEIGDRYVGDKYSWVIPLARHDTNAPRPVPAAIACGNPDCTMPVEFQILKRCSSCRARYYCSRVCQVIHWHVHRIICVRRAQERPVQGWENSILFFHHLYGPFLASYALGVVTAVSDLDPDQLPSAAQWQTAWLTYTCAVEITVTKVTDSPSGGTFIVKFLRMLPVHVDGYLSVSRLRGYKNNIRKEDFSYSLLFVVVPYLHSPSSSRSTMNTNNQLSYAPLSPIEYFLLSHDHYFTHAFLRAWSISEVVMLGKANRRLRHITQFFMKETWNLSKFYRGFFCRMDAAIDLFSNGDAIIYGPRVMKFFDKALSSYIMDDSDPLDVCIHVQSIEKLIDLLDDEGYLFRSYNTTSFRQTINNELANTAPWKLKSSGERNTREEDHSAWGPYVFLRMIHRHWCHEVRVHVVRCEPYQHILSLHSTGLMQFIAWNRAISLFPRNTFIHRVSLVSSQEEVIRAKFSNEYKKWFDGYAAKTGVKIVGLDHKQHDRREYGKRFIGDSRCWTILYEGEGTIIIDRNITRLTVTRKCRT
ncbi:hypothetical protein CVT26_012199 [Gymnopilus dilepis]|uniref:MYND-type domain-containing protein n=1 Tax=Gymnopilus dilepis TaxID=231916 RepID=A0A409YC73_9AGAR|nr:hypothetical protein CVT26_012199 [Gymnopilus dilepis]